MPGREKAYIPLLSILALYVILAIGLNFSDFLSPPRFVHRDGKYLVDGDGKQLQIRGINLGNWLVPEGYMFGFKSGPKSPRDLETLVNELVGPELSAQFWHQYRENYTTEEDIRFLHQAGFNTIRVPLHYKFFMPGDDAEGFRLLDRLIGWAQKYNLYVILDLHAAPGGQTGSTIDDSTGYPQLFSSPENQENTLRFWQSIAERYRNNPTLLGYDLLNEPLPNIPQLQKYNAMLEPLYKRITSGIRQVDSHHVIIIGATNWGYDFKLFGPPFDNNVMYSFHYYWQPPIEKGIQPYLSYREKYNIPIYLGESGENTDKWIKTMTDLMEKEHVGWSFWPYKKMEGASGVVSWQKPRYWNEITAFAARTKENKITAPKPSLIHSQAALDDLLEKIRFSQCTVNAGYLRALGLR
jgi:endoglucanase